MPENIVYTVTPRPESEYFLDRPALDKLLRNAFEKPLTIVIAGAGYGKTQAVSAALKSINCKSAWMQISELDNHVSRFWERISHIFEPYSHSLPEKLVALGYPESIAIFDQFLRLLVKALTQKERFILVFDDFHLIDNRTILNFIELFVSACIQNFSIVVISRKKPDLSMVSMLSKGLLAQITEDDLRFSRDEMDAYFRKQNIQFSEQAASDIYSFTDGWIFAIYLVGLAARKGTISNDHPVLAVKVDIFDLIEKEIFSKASQELQNFLVKISILDFVPSSLLKELTDHNLSLISEMLQISTFIRYDAFSDCYRIHHLFKEFLLEKANFLKREEITKIHLIAARWHQKNGHKTEAIDRYKKCGCYDEIFDIILSYAHHVAKETADLFIKTIEQAPDEFISARPIMRVVKANYLFNNNKIADSKRELLKIKKEYEALPETEETMAVLGEAYITLGLISILNSDYEFETLFKKAAAYLPRGSQLYDYKYNLADGLNVCNINNSSPGELQRHQDALFRTAPYAARVMNGCGYGLEYLNAAESCLYMGDLKESEKYAYEAIYRSRQYLQYDIEYMAYFVLVRIFTAKGNYQKISEILDQMKVQLETLQISDCLPLYDMISGWFYVKTENTDQVAKWIKYEEETRKMLAPVILGREYLVRSDCLLAEKRYYELLAFMKQTDKMYKDRGILFAIIQNKITKSIINHYMGERAESVNALQEAYELAYPNNLIMQFVEYGGKMRTLIHAARKNEGCKIPKEWLNKIYIKSSTYAKQLSLIVSAYNAVHAPENTDQAKLSDRESEVLRYLYRGMTREEIAVNCYLSLSTINSVIRNIYAKLNAANIADAIRIAKEKQIL